MINKGKFPVWNEKLCFICFDDVTIKFEVWDWETMQKNNFVGKGECSIGRIISLLYFPIYFCIN